MAKKSVKFMLGMMLGTAFGMAFAPKKGKELREELVKDIKTGKGEKFLKHNAKLVGKDVQDTAKEVYNSKEVQTKIKEGKTQASKLAKQVQKEMKSRAGEWTEMARDRLEEAGIKTPEMPKFKTKKAPAKKASAKKSSSSGKAKSKSKNKK